MALEDPGVPGWIDDFRFAGIGSFLVRPLLIDLADLSDAVC